MRRRSIWVCQVEVMMSLMLKLKEILIRNLIMQLTVSSSHLTRVEEVEVDNLLPVLPWLCVDVCDLRDS